MATAREQSRKVVHNKQNKLGRSPIGVITFDTALKHLCNI